MTESYGVLTVGSVTSGTVADGEEVTGAGVASLTAIDGNLSGSGAGSTWLVKNAQTVAPESMTNEATPLIVAYNSIVGATANRDYFEVSPNGDFGFDYNPGALSYMGGTAAAALGLTQASGALDSTSSGFPTSAAAYMNNLVQNENSRFGSFQNSAGALEQLDPEYLGDLAAWAQSTDGLYTFGQSTSSTLPAGWSMPTTDPAGTYSDPGASAPTPDPAGTYSGPGASAPTLAAAGTYIPVSGATSAAAEIVSPPGTYGPAGASAPIADPGGTYSAAGASAPTTDPAGTYTSPYALDRLFLEAALTTPGTSVLSFNSATAVANYYGATSAEASLANEFFAGYAGTSATMLFTRYMPAGERSHLLGANISNLTLSQLQSINGSLSITFQGNTYSGSINLSGVSGFSAAATAITSALNSNLPVDGRYGWKFDRAGLGFLHRFPQRVSSPSHVGLVRQH